MIILSPIVIDSRHISLFVFSTFLNQDKDYISIHKEALYDATAVFTKQIDTMRLKAVTDNEQLYYLWFSYLVKGKLETIPLGTVNYYKTWTLRYRS